MVQCHFKGPRYVMSPEIYERYEEAFAASNEWVRAKYFPERKSLFGASATTIATQPDNDAILDQLASFTVGFASTVKPGRP